jgi:hypothetical protein
VPAAVIAQVNELGKNEPSILTFTNWQGWEINDHPQDYDELIWSDEDDVGILIVDPTPEDDVELPGVDPVLMPSPQEWRWRAMTMSPKSWLRSLRLMALGNTIQERRLLLKQFLCHPLHLQDIMSGRGSNRRGTFPA